MFTIEIQKFSKWRPFYSVVFLYIGRVTQLIITLNYMIVRFNGTILHTTSLRSEMKGVVVENEISNHDLPRSVPIVTSPAESLSGGP